MPAILALVFAIAVAIAGAVGYHKGHSDRDKDCTIEKAVADKKYTDTVEKYRKTEQEWAAKVGAIQEEKKREIADINARHAAAVNSLRNRPERAPGFKPGVPEAPAACVGVSGAELARGDGEFLAGYAADAAKLYKALKQCEQQYNETE